MGFEIERGKLDDALYWDTQDPYHYVRLTSGTDGKDVLIVGGEDHKTGEADDARCALSPPSHPGSRRSFRTSARALPLVRPGHGHARLRRLHRAGGWQRNGTFVSTGDSGQGITHGVVASLIIPDLIWARKTSSPRSMTLTESRSRPRRLM
jgi:hypothetical protein